MPLPLEVKCLKCAQCLLHILKVKSHGPVQPTHPLRKERGDATYKMGDITHSYKNVAPCRTTCSPILHTFYLSSYVFEASPEGRPMPTSAM